jgi:heat shock protein HtpX
MSEGAGALKTEIKYTIDTELSVGNLEFLPEYLRRHYILRHKKYRDFKNIYLFPENGVEHLSYRVLIPETEQYVDVTVASTVPIEVTMRPSFEGVQRSFLDQLNEDLFLVVQLYEEEVRKTTLYLAFMPGEKLAHKKERTNTRLRLFSDSMLLIYIALMASTFVFFFAFGSYAPLFFVCFSFLLAIFSGNLIARTADWKVTRDRAEVHLIQYNFSPEDFKEFREKYAKVIPEIRREIYATTVAVDKPIDCEIAGRVFAKYGVECKEKDFSVKKVNLYQIVEKAATSFGVKTPKIAVINSLIPNAAAAGPSPGTGTIMVTTGLMTQLEEDELLGVIGHEVSHLKAHDPLVLFALSSAEYLIRFYLLWPYLFALGFYSYWFYFIFAMGLIYFFGKFLEGRADLDAAKMIGQPKALAEGLRKIAFRRLFPLQKREPAFQGHRKREWLQFDPHPPAYFRISRLESLEEPEKIKNTFIRSVRDSIRAFLGK